MSLQFEWDEDKAGRNRVKHGFSFEEASTVFSDPFELTIHDPLHSDEEDRFVSLAESSHRRLLVVVFTERGDRIRIISARKATRAARGGSMKKAKGDPDLLEEYDFSKAVRGKHAERYAEGTNVVLLAPDLAELFPDSDSVNNALRLLVRAGRQCQAGRSVVKRGMPYRRKPAKTPKQER